MANGKKPDNDGWTELDYSFGDDDEFNARLSKLINELCHVFRQHADGNWKSFYKPKYVALFAEEIRAKRSLARKLIALNQREVSNVTYAALEQIEGEAVDGTGSQED